MPPFSHFVPFLSTVFNWCCSAFPAPFLSPFFPSTDLPFHYPYTSFSLHPYLSLSFLSFSLHLFCFLTSVHCRNLQWCKVNLYWLLPREHINFKSVHVDWTLFWWAYYNRSAALLIGLSVIWGSRFVRSVAHLHMQHGIFTQTLKWY